MRYIELYENDLDENSVIELLKNDYSSAYQKYKEGIKIYRGTGKAPNNIFIYDFAYERKSLHNLNYYTYLMDNLPSWSNYPKRGRSAICTTYVQTTGSYGDTFIVLPRNNSKIGIAPYNDIWFSFINIKNITGARNLDIFTERLKFIFETFNIKMAPHTYNEFVANIESIENEFKKNHKVALDKIVTAIADHCGSNATRLKHDLYSFFNSLFPNFFVKANEIFDPTKNGFNLETIENFRIDDGPHEVWMEVPVLMIKEDVLKLINISL